MGVVTDDDLRDGNGVEVEAHSLGVLRDAYVGSAQESQKSPQTRGASERMGERDREVGRANEKRYCLREPLGARGN